MNNFDESNVTVGRADSLVPGDVFRNRNGRWVKVTGLVIEGSQVAIRGIDTGTTREMFCFYLPGEIRKIIRRGEAPPSI